MIHRRRFIQVAALGAASWQLSACSVREPTSPTTRPPLRVLILGGTGFIGPHMVRYAQARGHELTLFNRGKTNPGLFPNVETLIGDRDGGLDALNGRQWDAVIDNSGHVPRHVRDSAQLLSTAADQYLFISSVSSYADFDTLGMDEAYPQGRMADETDEARTPENYGPMKALCERAVSAAFSGRTTIFRPGFIVGPGDRSDRWTYWPARIARGGIMLVPGEPSDPVQLIDVRDLARFTVLALEDRLYKTYNVTGPADALSMGAMIDAMRSTLNSDAAPRWVDGTTVRARQVRFPIWASAQGPYRGIHQIRNARAIGDGLSFQSLERTIEDTHQWWLSLPTERRQGMRAGLRRTNAGAPGPLSMEEQMQIESELAASL